MFSIPGFNPTVPKNLDIDTMEQRKRILTKELKVYIEQIVANSSRYIRDKSALERFFGTAPGDIETLRGFSYFLRGTVLAALYRFKDEVPELVPYWLRLPFNRVQNIGILLLGDSY